MQGVGDAIRLSRSVMTPDIAPASEGETSSLVQPSQSAAKLTCNTSAEGSLGLRKQIEQYLNQHLWFNAHATLAELWSKHATPASAGYVITCYERLKTHLPLTSCRVFLLRSFTVEPVVPLLRAGAFVGGIDSHVHLGDFGTYAQEILDPSSRLYTLGSDVVVLAIETRDIAPDLWGTYPDLSAAEVEAAVQRVVDSFQKWVKVFRSRSQADLIVHTLEVPSLPSQGILDHQAGNGQRAAVQQINQELRQLVEDHPGVYILDYDALVARYGAEHWYDERKWLTMRMPIAASHLVHLANEWGRFIHPLTGKICKALVTDLDNTLWGGVIGEEGIRGIELGAEYPGAAYQSLQRVMCDLYKRGIILAVCSKNNLSDALEALEHHPGMLLRPKHFAALRINWNDKVENLREIAEELNIGMDALAFLDDNPVERERVRTELPEVTVIDLPEDPMGYARALRETPVFERLVLSAEDRERGRYYGAQRQRDELERKVPSLEDFYDSLQQEVEIAPVKPETLARVAQLTQKTNQFNLTTKRYHEQQIVEMTTRRGWNIYSVRVKDRFGDNGLVGVCITHDADDVCEIDSFLLSCRVIGRTIDTAMLSFLCEQARARDIRELRGCFVPTNRNTPTKDFYPKHGFLLRAETENGSLWSLELQDHEIKCPEWIRLKLNSA